MKSYELKPTIENLCNTFCENTIGRNVDIVLFSEILNSISDAYSIAIDGNWGSGKTFFVKQTKLFMDAHNDFIDFENEENRSVFQNSSFKVLDTYIPQVSVYYDAWENDNDNEPILSLIYSIISNVDTDFTLKNGDGCFEKAASILEFFSGKNWSGIVESFKSESPLDDIKRNKDIEEKIKEFLDSLLEERGDRLIVFVDELDRCKPSYAVKLLERIKHYFTNDRITFVFSINTSELQHTIKRFYGDNFDACRYLDRFFDLRISLPPANKPRFYQSIDFDNGYYTFDVVCSAVIDNYDFSLRETAKFIRLYKMVARDSIQDGNAYYYGFPNEKTKHFCLIYIVPIMLGLKVYNIDLYEDFVSGRDCTPLFEVAKRLGDHHFAHLLNCDETFDIDENGKTLVDIAVKLKQVYEAIFVTLHPRNDHSIAIGDCNFDNHIKDLLLRVISLFSVFSTI